MPRPKMFEELDEARAANVRGDRSRYKAIAQQFQTASGGTIQLPGIATGQTHSEPKMTNTKILISAIELNPARQPRVEINKSHVSDMKEHLAAGGELPAIEVYSANGKAPYFISDGFHRLEANVLAGYKEIFADVKTGTAFDAFRASLGKNDSHGLKRTNADKRRAITLALEDERLRELSDRAIAEICGVSHVAVFEIRKQVAPPESSEVLTVNTSNDENEPDSPKEDEKPQTRKGRDGKNHPAKKGSSSKKKTESKDEVPKFITEKIGEVKDSNFHASVLLERFKKGGVYGKVPKRILDMLREIQRSCEAIICQECNGTKCAACDKVGVILKVPFAKE